jgi:glycosyltransferase involved in cell wall biosynthesis
MIVGLDGQALFSPTSGIGVYVRRLVENILALEPDVNFQLHVPVPAKRLFAANRDGAGSELAVRYSGRVSVYERRFPPARALRWLWRSSNFLPLDATMTDIDIYHGTNFVVPPLSRVPSVVTIFDVIMLLPEFGVSMFRREELQRYIDRADAVICISDHTKNDVINFFKVPEEKMRVTLLAADERFAPIADHDAVSRVTKRLGIEGEYILYTGTMDSRKNILTLVRAFDMLKKEKRIDHKLVLAGKKGWLYEEILESVRTLGLEKDVVFTGFVADDDMPYLYNGAVLFAYPSLYEGFGLPPLEAMACGCPVVTSNTTSLPEVVGDAGLMVDPERPEELADAMGRIIEESELRAGLRARGLLRAAEFSWKRCAGETLEIYRSLKG